MLQRSIKLAMLRCNMSVSLSSEIFEMKKPCSPQLINSLLAHPLLFKWRLKSDGAIPLVYNTALSSQV